MGGRRRDRGSKIAEGLDIESVHDQAKGTQNKDAGLKCSDLALVDGFGDVDRTFHYGFREYITSPRLSFCAKRKKLELGLEGLGLALQESYGV